MSKSKKWVFFIGYIFFLLLLDTLWYWRVDQALDNANINIVLRECLYITGKLVMMVIPVLLYLKYIDLKEPFEYLKLKNHKITGIKWGFIVGAGFVIYYLIIASITKAMNINFNIGINYWIAGLLVGFVEEVPFRGFILQKLQEHFNFWTANLITVFIFLLYHYPTWFFSGHFKLFGFNVVFTGIIFGYMLKKSKSLWSAIITHSIIDLSIWIIIGLS
jgi:membrane protease YdiL (CAAX protease family)